MFSFLSKENKKKVDSAFFASAVNNSIQTKTLSGSPFKPPFLGVVVDFWFFTPEAKDMAHEALNKAKSESGLKAGGQNTPNVSDTSTRHNA